MTRACLVFGCGDPVTTRGRCARHVQQVDAARSIGTDRQAGAALYQSARWKALRAFLLARYPVCTCVECVQVGRVRASAVVHHLEAHGGDPARFFDVTNLQALAKVCHDRLTAKARGGSFSGTKRSAVTAWPCSVSGRESDLGARRPQKGGSRG